MPGLFRAHGVRKPIHRLESTRSAVDSAPTGR
jgi:hypothetical protein